MKLIDKIKKHPAVKDIEDEGDDGPYKHNYFVNLNEGYLDTESGCGGLAEYTLTSILYRLQHYVKYDIESYRKACYIKTNK